MTDNSIRKAVNNVVSQLEANTTLPQVKELLNQAQLLVRQFYAQQMGVALAEPEVLTQAAADLPHDIHRITTQYFGFDVYEQPDYGDIDDVAWRMSQKITDLSQAALPSNARFTSKDGRSVDRAEVEKRMASGDFYLFDIALSNQYVLLGNDEQFSVRDIENRFSTNNEHLSPQSLARRVGQVKVFKSDPRMIIISDMKNNGDRGHLQVVFRDENRNTQSTVAMVHEPGKAEPRLLREDFTASGSNRYEIDPEDAPFYAYALALTHFADGFSEGAKNNWFDKKQATEVLKMLNILAEKGVDGNFETVMRDVLADAKQLGGNINPVALMPEVFAKALETEIARDTFRERGEASFWRDLEAERAAMSQQASRQRLG